MKTLCAVAVLAVWAIPCLGADQDPSTLEAIDRLNVLDSEIDTGAEQAAKELAALEEKMSKFFPFTLSGEIRVREEYWNNYYGPGANSDGRESFDYAHMRTRLRFDVDIEKDLTAVIELQDVRTWGDGMTTTSDDEGVDIKRSAFMVHNLLNEPLTVEVGRYVMYYGDQRLIGHLEWVDQGRTYDGFRTSYAPDDWYFDVFFVRVNDLAFDDSDDRDFYGVYSGTKPAGDFPGIEGYCLYYRDDVRQTGTPLSDTKQRILTVGSRLHAKMDHFDYTGEAAIQTGDDGEDDLFAYAFALTGGLTFADCPWKTRVGGEISHATGDRRGTDSDSQQFKTLFPTNHIFYGYADLIGWSNMWNFSANVRTHPDEFWTFECAYHHINLDDTDGGWFNAAGKLVRSTGGAPASRHLGDEIDLLAKWKATDHIHLLGGYSHFFTGGFIDDTAGDNKDLDFLYVQARVTF